MHNLKCIFVISCRENRVVDHQNGGRPAKTHDPSFYIMEISIFYKHSAIDFAL